MTPFVGGLSEQSVSGLACGDRGSGSRGTSVPTGTRLSLRPRVALYLQVLWWWCQVSCMQQTENTYWSLPLKAVV